MNSIKYGCTALKGVNKVGNLKFDGNYVTMIVGALNVLNSANQFYDAASSLRLFEESGALQRRVARGALRGEYGHPKPLPNQSPEEFVRRVMTIYEERVCCHHAELTLDCNLLKDENGKPIVAIVSRLCPSGELGHVLERSLNNKEENVCFSIRSFTHDYFEHGIQKRTLKSVVTFDYVNEPGISYANKFLSPSLESSGSDIIVSRGAIERAVINSDNGVGQESVVLTASELFSSMGWNNGNDMPAWSKW